MKDSIKKEIDSLIAKRSNLTTILIVLVTGTIGLVFNFKLIYLIPMSIGFISITIFANGLLNTETKIRYLIASIKSIKELKE